MECFKSPTPIGIKLVPAQVQVEDLLSSNSCHWFSLMCVFQFNRQFFWEKRCFEKQCVRCLACIPQPDLHLGKTKQVFCFDLRSWYCLFLKVLRVRHLEKYFAVCLPAVCQVRELPRQNVCTNCCMSDVCEFWLQLSRLSHFIYLDFSTLHSCRPGCIPSVERLSSSVKYCLDFEHLQNDTSKGCAWYCGAGRS